MEIAHNHNVKSQLAKLLAMEKITVQHRGDIQTAMFDPRNRILYLPIWRQMSADLYDLLIVHEVGHALDTPRGDNWMKSLESMAKRLCGSASARALFAIKQFVNVIEDCRIDKRQKRRYPGSRRNYLNGYKELWENNFFGTKGKDINSLLFIDRINIHFKVGVAAGVKFSKEENVFVQRIADAETWEEVLQLSEEVFQFSRDQQKQQTPTPGADQSDFEDSDEMEMDDSEWNFDDSEECMADFDSDSEEDEDGVDRVGGGDAEDEDESEGEGSSDDAEGEGEEDESGEKSEAGEEGEEAEGNSSESEDGEDSESGAEAGEADSSEEEGQGEGKIAQDPTAGSSSKDTSRDDENLPQSETEQAWEDKSKNLVASSDTAYYYMNLPEPKLDFIVDDYKVVLADMRQNFRNHSVEWKDKTRRQVNRWRSDENNTISFMVKEFETRKSADAYSKIQIAKTGVINTNKLHSYKFNDDIFRRNTIVPTGKNHGFVMLLDWSGSMTGEISNTLRQLYTLTMFCRRVQIPFEVYTFRDVCGDETPNSAGNSYTRMQYHDHKSKGNYAWTFPKDHTVVFEEFKLRNILSSRMNAADMLEMMCYLWDARNIGYEKDPMGGTPLNAALSMFDHVVNNFKKRSKVQIVNTVILTDGQSNGFYNIHGLANKQVPVHAGTKEVNYFINDDVLRKQFNIGISRYLAGFSGIDTSGVTRVLLERLKERTGTNLIGFYLTNSSFNAEFRNQFGYGTNEKFEKEMRTYWETNGFFPVASQGYDKYFILSAYKLNQKDKKLVITENMINRSIAKAFSAYAESKTVNRVLLRQFIAEIAS